MHPKQEETLYKESPFSLCLPQWKTTISSILLIFVHEKTSSFEGNCACALVGKWPGMQLEEFRSEMDEDELCQFTSDYYIPLDVHPELPDADACIADFPEGENRGVHALFWVRKPARAYIPIFERRAQLLPPTYFAAALYRCGENNKFRGKLSFTCDKPHYQLISRVLPYDVVERVDNVFEAPRALSVLYWKSRLP